MAKLLGQALVGSVPWLDRVADLLQPRVRAVLDASSTLRNALDGTWIGVPLHPALTDVPVGATTAAVLLDGAESLSGRAPTLAAAADASLAVGVLAAVPAAATGAADWRYLRDETRRIATLHALLNVGALLLNLASLGFRIRGRRQLGKLFSAVAYGLTSAAAHIGGELTFGSGVRVNRAARQQGPAEFVAVMRDDELEASGLKRVELDGAPVLLTRASGGQPCAIAATCTHFGGPLDQGHREGDTVSCPWHGSRFELCSGAVLDGPAVFDQPRYDVRVRDGKIELRLGSPS